MALGVGGATYAQVLPHMGAGAEQRRACDEKSTESRCAMTAGGCCRVMRMPADSAAARSSARRRVYLPAPG